MLDNSKEIEAAMARQEKFYELKNRYEQETMLSSSPCFEHEDFKEIVAMGKDIIPLLLANLYNSWTANKVLFMIVGKVFDLNPETEAGRFDIICEKWYRWGNENGYI